MAIILKCVDVPVACAVCPFAERMDNMRTYCKWYPTEPPTCDGEEIPEYCPIEPVVCE